MHACTKNSFKGYMNLCKGAMSKAEYMTFSCNQLTVYDYVTRALVFKKVQI